eukprot:10546173-Alexandrium_andersonii.AAC.1
MPKQRRQSLPCFVDVDLLTLFGGERSRRVATNCRMLQEGSNSLPVPVIEPGTTWPRRHIRRRWRSRRFTVNARAP